jgi:tRNA pseudouridine55 synthase
MYVLNEIKRDEFGRPHGILLVNKPVGITSHDLVDQARRKFNTRKVGHAGALDPFASGLIILLIGKATTYANEMIGLDKTYNSRFVLGIDTDSGDIEGNILNFEKFNLNVGDVETELQSFEGGYEQYVPVYSSVKVNGKKLRKLARKYSNFEIVDYGDKKVVEFFKDNKLIEKLDLPKRFVNIYEIELCSSGSYNSVEDIFSKYTTDSKVKQLEKILPINYIDVKFSCSKGTYVRQFAKDLADKLGTFGMVNILERTRIGDYLLNMAVDLDKFFD